MKRFLVGVIQVVFLLIPGLAFAQAGYVHALTGTATVQPQGAAARPLRVGDLIDNGATIRTNGASTAVVKFEDGQVRALRENTGFRVTDYSYNKANVSNSRAVFNLLQGGLRFITGVIGAT